MFNGYVMNHNNISSYYTTGGDMVYNIDWDTLYQEVELIRFAFITEQAI